METWSDVVPGPDALGQDSPERDAPVLAGLAPRVTASAAIARILRDEIVAMTLLPGMPFSEKELTARFGVSRTPVREALIRLAEEGLVEVRPQSGTSVARIPLAAIPEAVVVRQALEGTTVELAATRGVEDGMGVLREIVARQQVCAERAEQTAFHEADEAFHEAIATICGHPGIWRIVRQAKMQIDRCRRLTLPVPGRMDQVVAEHRVILQAVEAGDPATARAAMTAHLQAVLPDAHLLARSHPGYFC